MTWKWPLLYKEHEVPQGDHHGAFGKVRKYDTHTGVDLYAPVGDPVRAVEGGVVVAIECFTGAPESPWWNPTQAVLVEGASGVVVYGEISPIVEVGKRINCGDRIGSVLQVLKKNKGLPMSMLHLELHKTGTRFTDVWTTNRPESLLDPTAKLLQSYNAYNDRSVGAILDSLYIPSTPITWRQIGDDRAAAMAYTITYNTGAAITDADYQPITIPQDDDLL